MPSPRPWAPVSGEVSAAAGRSTSDSATRRSVGLTVGIVLVWLGLVGIWTSVLVPWSSTDAQALLGDAANAAFNAPSLLRVSVAAVLTLIRPARVLVAPLVLVVALLNYAGLASDFEEFTAISKEGGDYLTAGIWISLLACSILLAASVLLWRATGITTKSDPAALKWAAGTTVASIVWLVGYALPWQRTTYTMTTDGWTWEATDSATLVRDCCTIFSGEAPASTRQGLTVLAVLVLGVLLPFLLPRTTAAVSVIGLGLALSADSLGWFVHLSEPVNLEGVPNQVEAGITAARSALPGGWISTLAALTLILIGVFMLLAQQSAERGETSGSRPPQDQEAHALQP